MQLSGGRCIQAANRWRPGCRELHGTSSKICRPGCPHSTEDEEDDGNDDGDDDDSEDDDDDAASKSTQRSQSRGTPSKDSTDGISSPA